MHKGQCLCGGVRFAITGELAPIQICYCKQCQRAQGAVLATNIPVAVTAFQFEAGRDLLRAFESSPGKERSFCSRCGSPIFSRRDSLPGVLRVRAGLLDAPIDTRPIAHFHTSAKPDWWMICDGLPQFPESYAPES
jgi:hypothetical protein